MPGVEGDVHEVVVRVEEEHSASSSSSVSGVFPKLSTCVTNHIFSFLSVQTLYQKQGVSRAFRQQCKVALKLKKQQLQPTGSQSATSVFTSRQALHSAVDAYCRCKYWRNRDESLAEQVATKYCWFIENWNVSQVTEFVYIFLPKAKLSRRSFQVGRQFCYQHGTNVSRRQEFYW